MRPPWARYCAREVTFEATARGLVVQQMIGIRPDRARDLYGIPQGSEAYTGLAIGYTGPRHDLPSACAERDQPPRTRKPLSEFMVQTWGKPARFAKP